MSQYSHPGPDPAAPAFRLPAAMLPASRTEARQSPLAGALFRIAAGLTSITIGFWGGSAALALHSMAAYMGPRFDWLATLLGLAAVFSVATGFTQIVRCRRRDLRIPALSVAFAAINVLAYVAVFVALPVMTPMLGGLVLSGVGIIILSLTMVLDAIYLPVLP